MKYLDIRCDGGTDIGMGHVVRCVALAEMLRDEFDIVFIVQETDDTIYSLIKSFGYTIKTISRTKDYSTDQLNTIEQLRDGSVVLLDGYHFKTAYQKTIRDNNHKLVVIDDLHDWHHVADIVINHAPGADKKNYRAEAYTRFLFGCKYALIRKEFYRYKNIKKENRQISRAVISMGASDLHNVTMKFAQVLNSIEDITQIHLLISGINPHKESLIRLHQSFQEKIYIHHDLDASELSTLIFDTDLMICPSSTIALESCCVGTTLATGYTAANQMDILQSIVTLDMGYNLGNLIDITNKQIEENISRILLGHLMNDDKFRQQQLQFNSYPQEAYITAFSTL